METTSGRFTSTHTDGAWSWARSEKIYNRQPLPDEPDAEDPETEAVLDVKPPSPGADGGELELSPLSPGAESLQSIEDSPALSPGELTGSPKGRVRPWA
jgi:hypothetical protein